MNPLEGRDVEIMIYISIAIKFKDHSTTLQKKKCSEGRENHGVMALDDKSRLTFILRPERCWRCRNTLSPYVIHGTCFIHVRVHKAIECQSIIAGYSPSLLVRLLRT